MPPFWRPPIVSVVLTRLRGDPAQPVRGDEEPTLARLVDLTVIKQGERIARQKGWAAPGRPTSKPPVGRGAAPRARRPPVADPAPPPRQPSLFSDLAP